MVKDKDKINVEDIQKVQGRLLNILHTIDIVCQQHHLTYYIIAGTELGAIRHKGFIPWDDDADVALPRPDYGKLLAHAEEWLPKEYELVDGKRNANYPYSFARIQERDSTYILRRQFNFVGGLPVDVFPLDGMTKNPLYQRLHFYRYRILKNLLYYTLRDPMKHGPGIGAIFFKTCHKLFSSKWLHRRLDHLQQEFDYESSNLVADHDNKYYRAILPKEVYGSPVRLKFENIELNGVAKADSYLRYCYGNYMQKPKVLPPRNFRYLNLQLPFRDYLRKHQF